MTKSAVKPRARATQFRGGVQPSAAAGGARLAETLTRYSVPAGCYEPAVPSLSTGNIIMMSLRFSQRSRTRPTASASGLVASCYGVFCRYRAMRYGSQLRVRSAGKPVRDVPGLYFGYGFKPVSLCRTGTSTQLRSALLEAAVWGGGPA